jgi:hypothetical protein
MMMSVDPQNDVTLLNQDWNHKLALCDHLLSHKLMCFHVVHVLIPQYQQT